MGMRFRKSKNLGPFRINLSKSGIGGSFGVKGIRFTKKANGGTRTTFSVPGTGLSWVSETPSANTRRKRKKAYKLAKREKKTAIKSQQRMEESIKREYGLTQGQVNKIKKMYYRDPKGTMSMSEDEIIRSVKGNTDKSYQRKSHGFLYYFLIIIIILGIIKAISNR